MKKYKLIKKYPGVKLEVGDLIEWSIPQNSSKYQYICRKKDIGVGGVIPSDYPEFWEEVKEKEYEILSVKINNDNIGIVINGTFNLIPAEKYKIHSIKRLSDGQVFTLGDKVDSTISDLGRATELTGFMQSGDKLMLGLRDLGYYPLSTVILPKKPLCKSADGVDIYEDDSVVCLNKEDWITRNQDYRFKPWDVKDKDYLFFSTLEAANEYILMNKPCLSLQDVMNTTFEVWDEKKKALNELKELVKTKLPQS